MANQNFAKSHYFFIIFSSDCPRTYTRYMKNFRPIGLKFFRKFLKIKKLILVKFGGQTSKNCKKNREKKRGGHFCPPPPARNRVKACQKVIKELSFPKKC